MQVRTNRMGVATYLAPDGALVMDSLAPLETAVTDARTHGAGDLVVDLRLVPFIDSRGLEYLLDLAIDLRQRGGSLRLAYPDAICKDILTVTGLDQTIAVFQDIASAGGSFL
jgi:anti-anti-sigma factor